MSQPSVNRGCWHCIHLLVKTSYLLPRTRPMHKGLQHWIVVAKQSKAARLCRLCNDNKWSVTIRTWHRVCLTQLWQRVAYEHEMIMEMVLVQCQPSIASTQLDCKPCKKIFMAIILQVVMQNLALSTIMMSKMHKYMSRSYDNCLIQGLGDRVTLWIEFHGTWQLSCLKEIWKFAENYVNIEDKSYIINLCKFFPIRALSLPENVFTCS